MSENSGATWKMHLPHLLNKIAPTELATQPITTAFRGKDGGLFMGVDSKGASSGLWKSMDNSTSWADTHGRTVGRHTCVVFDEPHTCHCECTYVMVAGHWGQDVFHDARSREDHGFWWQEF